MGKYFESVMNNEFKWNLFFRILFTLEPLNNVGDFEKFLVYIKMTYTESKYINRQKDMLRDRFNEDFLTIENAINEQVAKTLVSLDKISIVYTNLIEDVNDSVEYIYKYIEDNIDTIEKWNKDCRSILIHLNNEIIEELE